MRARERTPIKVRMNLVPDGERLRSTTKNVQRYNLGLTSLSTRSEIRLHCHLIPAGILLI